MTGELSPAAGGPAAGTPALRASHADRDRAVDILRVAAGDGRLTAAELDERLEAALTARTVGELAELTADLPAGAVPPDTAAAQPKELAEIDCRGSTVRRAGAWVVPQRMRIRAIGGTVDLDFSAAVITRPALQIDAEVHGGALTLVTRPGIEVDTDEVTLAGGTVKVRPHPGPAVPVTLRVEISGQARGGTIVARPPRRIFWQWLRRRS
ncbi:MAG: DUF1707 domain-containing protein [Streptosporangiaceae bacterium]